MVDVQREVRELLETSRADGEAGAVSTPGSSAPVGRDAGPATGPADLPEALAGDPPAAGAPRAAAQGHSAERGAVDLGRGHAAAVAAAPTEQPSRSDGGQQDGTLPQHSGGSPPQAPRAAGGRQESGAGAVLLDDREHGGGPSIRSEGPTAVGSTSDSGGSEGSIIGFEAEALTPAERCVAAAAGELVDTARAAVRLHVLAWKRVG